MLGCGYHADFINGWNVDTLQAAVDQCTNLSGRVEDCPVFSGSLQSEPKMGTCEIQKMPSTLEADDCVGPTKGLCGDVPVQYGPGYANPLGPLSPLLPGSPDKTSSLVISSAPVPTQSYAPARSEGPGGVSVYNVKPSPAPKPEPAPAPAPAPAPKPVEPQNVPVVEKPAPAPPAPIVTPAPAKPEGAANPGKIIGTSSYTSNGIEYVVAIEEVEVIVYVTEDSKKMRNKRHAHAKAHARRHAERRN